MKIKILAIAIVSMLMVACNDTDIAEFSSPASDIGTGTLENTDRTITSLTFVWQPVAGVHQYGYTLTNAHGTSVRQGVTDATSVTFVNLELDSDYEIRVEAFGDNGVPTQVMTMRATTMAPQKLATPDVAQMAVDIDPDGVVTISWPSIANADTYDYVLRNAVTDKELSSGTVTDSSVTFLTMAVGSYALDVTAHSDFPEGYPDSDTATFTFDRNLMVVGEYDCVYTSYALGQSARKIVKYEDGTYEILAFYGVEGYNLKFKVGSGTITILNHVTENGVYRDVATGLAEHPTLTVTTGKRYCIYSPQTAEGRRVKMQSQLAGVSGSGQDIFTWDE